MERRNLALLCAGVLCFWLFALAFGTAEGRGVAVQAELPTAARRRWKMSRWWTLRRSRS